MMWVELYTVKGQVGHCSYYWQAVQLTDIKSQLVELNMQIKKDFHATPA